ncbi:40s ribosomal protein s10 [Filobasidium floriforme]|uniref:40s ribosomal protein s10 n=1 Tax=Filobasidium floriforme TaxID=5210 RepID=UPI001E8EC7BD|nr:40s ribosomal protein s10 [Filobasidium floriforme]KAH8081942.1 40s ribosomal protein s10 [Filobasidium floriforme]
MLISKENRRAIYESLFKEGVMVAEKDFNAPSHPDLPQVRNLEVIKAMQSLTSKGYVKTQFSWQWYYYTLTPEGLDYLREVGVGSELITDYSAFAFLLTFVHPVLFVLVPTRDLQFLHLPSEIVPQTHKKPVRAQPPARQGGAGRDGAYRAPRGGDREGYRRREDGDAKEGSGEFKPRFAGGIGRGAPLS